VALSKEALIPMKTLQIARPIDAHVHLRTGALMQAVLPATAAVFGRAVVMPNIVPPATTTAAVESYRADILDSLPEGSAFEPLMTLYLTDGTDPDDLEKGARDGVLAAAKLYPMGATTHSAAGVSDLQNLAVVFERMQRCGLPLLIHGEIPDESIDIFDREAVFIDRVLIPLRRNFPDLRIVLEHITTSEAVTYVFSEGQGGKLAATITPHHLLINRNALFAGGLQPHMFCRPVAKREKHRQAVVSAATSGAPMFFLGTDSAPHSRALKEGSNGCAGIFSALNALALYAHVFEQAESLDRLEDFASVNAATFYRLPIATETVTLERLDRPVEPLKPILTAKGAEIVPFDAPSTLFWRVVAQTPG
jgi:dihydroorotase